MGLKWGFLSFIENWGMEYFWYFVWKYSHWVTELHDFLWKDLVFPKRSKMGFLSCITNQCIEFFWFFAWNCNSWKNWVKLSWLNSWFLGCLDRMDSKRTWNKVLIRFFKIYIQLINEAWYISIFDTLNCSSIKIWNCVKQLFSFVEN